uniref:DDE Tnp4 domain-containing protein n=1 Tax=Myripristis murdjan TaxID=586833 RepID=A0A667Z914_9TELE
GRRISLFDLTETKIIHRYRLPGQIILALLDDIKNDIEPATLRSHVINGIVKLLSIIQVLACGTFQTPVAGASGLSQPSINWAVWNVPAITHRVVTCIRFPQNRWEAGGTKQKLFNVSSFPNVVCAIDCSHVPPVPPWDNGNVFKNREITFSINILLRFNANNIIMNMVTKFPEPVHDSYNFRNRNIYRMVQNMDDSPWLLGDSGYQMQPWMMTPVCNPTNDGEVAHNQEQIKPWDSVLCILPTVCQIRVVCCILHNIAMRASLRPEEHGDDQDSQQDEEEPPAQCLIYENLRETLIGFDYFYVMIFVIIIINVVVYYHVFYSYHATIMALM